MDQKQIKLIIILTSLGQQNIKHISSHGPDIYIQVTAWSFGLSINKSKPKPQVSVTKSNNHATENPPKIKKIQYQINIVKSLNCVCCVLQFIIYLLFRSSPRWDKKERVDGAQQYKIWNRPTRQCSPWAWFIGPKSPLLYTVAIYSRYCYIIYHNQQPRIDTHFLSASGPSLDTTHCVITETVASSPCRSSSLLSARIMHF